MELVDLGDVTFLETQLRIPPEILLEFSSRITLGSLPWIFPAILTKIPIRIPSWTNPGVSPGIPPENPSWFPPGIAAEIPKEIPPGTSTRINPSIPTRIFFFEIFYRHCSRNSDRDFCRGSLRNFVYGFLQGYLLESDQKGISKLLQVALFYYNDSCNNGCNKRCTGNS